MNLPTNQSSTPFKSNKISSKKNKKKSKLKKKSNFVYTLDHESQITKHSKKCSPTTINSNLKVKEKYDLFEKSTLLSSHSVPYMSNIKKNKKNQNQNSMNLKRKCNKNVKTPSSWLTKTQNYFLETRSPKNILNNHSLVLTKPFELKEKELPNEEPIQSTKYKNTHSSKEEEEDPVSAIDVNKSIELNSYDCNIIEVNSKSFENEEFYSISEEDTSKLSNIFCKNNIDVSVNNQPCIDIPTITSCNLPVLVQYSSTPTHNNTENVVQNNIEFSTINNSYSNINKSCLDSFDTMSPSKENNKYKQIESNKLNCVNFITYQRSEVENNCLQPKNNKFDDCASDSQILLDDTSMISNITINDQINKCNQSSNVSPDEFTTDNNFSNDSHQTYTSSSSEQDTVINNQKSSCNILNNLCNANFSNLSMDKKSIRPEFSINYHDPMISEQDCSWIPDHCQSDSEKSETNYIDTSSCLLSHFENRKTMFKDVSCVEYAEQSIIEKQTLMCNNTFDDKLEKTNASNFSNTNLRRKRYASRFDQSIKLNSYKDFKNENNFEFQNSTHRYQDCSQSVLSQHNTTGFCLQPGKKWRRSISIVRNYINGQLDQTTNFTANTAKGRKWCSTVDNLLQLQHISKCFFFRHISLYCLQ